MKHLLHGLDVVLVQTRFPENIGMAARACVNMGCEHISLVAPERWLRDKAAPLATPKGQGILDGISLHESLAEAVADSTLVIGTTARRGGWRQAMLSPEACAAEVADCLRQGGRVSLVFGPEDRGLDNAAITHCHRLVCIPTDPEASSLNLAQAVLLLLYACASAMRAAERGEPAPVHIAAGPERPEETPPGEAPSGTAGHGAPATAADMERLMNALRDMLLRIDYLHGDNPDYFLMPWRRLFGRARLKRHEYDAFMGLCRQVRRALERAERAGKQGRQESDGA